MPRWIAGRGAIAASAKFPPRSACGNPITGTVTVAADAAPHRRYGRAASAQAASTASAYTAARNSYSSLNPAPARATAGTYHNASLGQKVVRGQDPSAQVPVAAGQVPSLEDDAGVVGGADEPVGHLRVQQIERGESGQQHEDGRAHKPEPRNRHGARSFRRAPGAPNRAVHGWRTGSCAPAALSIPRLLSALRTRVFAGFHGPAAAPGFARGPPGNNSLQGEVFWV